MSIKSLGDKFAEKYSDAITEEKTAIIKSLYDISLQASQAAKNLQHHSLSEFDDKYSFLIESLIDGIEKLSETYNKHLNR